MLIKGLERERDRVPKEGLFDMVTFKQRRSEPSRYQLSVSAKSLRQERVRDVQGIVRKSGWLQERKK